MTTGANRILCNSKPSLAEYASHKPSGTVSSLFKEKETVSPLKKPNTKWPLDFFKGCENKLEASLDTIATLRVPKPTLNPPKADSKAGARRRPRLAAAQPGAGSARVDPREKWENGSSHEAN